MVMVMGVDTTANVTNIVAALKANGYQFVGRYYSDTANEWKIMSVQESAAIAKAGLQGVVVFQNTNYNYKYFSEKQRTKDASAAISLAKARGQRSGFAIYFTVDYDASEEEVNGQIKEYFKAVEVDRDMATGINSIGAW